MRLFVYMFAVFVLFAIASVALPESASAQERIAGGGNDVAMLKQLADEEVGRMPGRALPTPPIRWNGTSRNPRNSHKAIRARVPTRASRPAVRRNH
jgi:hypothetical protein